LRRRILGGLITEYERAAWRSPASQDLLGHHRAGPWHHQRRDDDL